MVKYNGFKKQTDFIFLVIRGNEPIEVIVSIFQYGQSVMDKTFCSYPFVSLIRCTYRKNVTARLNGLAQETPEDRKNLAVFR